jgi:type IV secretory pathway TrbF-like protein
MDPIGGVDGSGGIIWVSTLSMHNPAGVRTTSFVLGEPIRFEFEIRNVTQSTVVVQFDTAQIYDFIVVDAGTARVRWQWSEGLGFTQTPTEITVAPNSSRSFTATWNGQLRDGSQLPAGTYQARGLMVFDEFFGDPLARNDMASGLQTFSVR